MNTPKQRARLVAQALIASSVAACLAGASPAAASMTLAQKTGGAACFGPEAPCALGIGIADVRSAEVSPDGRNVYAASGQSTLTIFDRAAGGTLQQKPGPAGCHADPTSPMDPAYCASANGLQVAFDVALSPDGRSVYIVSLLGGAVATFDRAANGTATQKPGSAGCISDAAEAPCADGLGLKEPQAVAVSADGKSVYVAAAASIAVFDRAEDGALTQKAGLAACVSETGNGPCTDGRALSHATALALSPDAASLYATSSEGVAVFDRSSDGTLTQKAGIAGCVSDAGSAGACTAGRALDGPTGVAVSPDGANLYVSVLNSAAVAVLDRGAGGALTQRAGAGGCNSALATGGACGTGRGLYKASSVTVSPDGASVYVTSRNETYVGGGLVFEGPGLLAMFDRSANGALTQPAGPAACLTDSGSGGACIDGTGVRGITALAVSPDGGNAYVAAGGGGTIGIFDRVAASPATTPPPPQPPEVSKPLLRGLALAPARFKAAARGASVVARGGSKISYRLSKPATLRFTVQRVVAGRRSGASCVAPSRSNRRAKRCDRFRSLAGNFVHAGATGTNALRFSDRLRSRRLVAGRYRLRAVAGDAAGNRSRAGLARFEIRRG